MRGNDGAAVGMTEQPAAGFPLRGNDESFEASHPMNNAPPLQSPATLAWYLLHTKPRQEQIALTNLDRQGYACYMPLINIEKIKRGKLAAVTEPMFPRYLFIQLDSTWSARSWSPIRSTLGVSQLVHFGNSPARVAGELIDIIKKEEQIQPARPLFAPGDPVSPIAGPFAGIQAIYQHSDGDSRSRILLTLLQQQVSVPVDTSNLRRNT